MKISPLWSSDNVGKLLKIFLVFVLILQLNFGYGQYKYEREKRVKESEVPEFSYQYINSQNFTKKIKWYREESQDGISYEAKVRHRGYLWSIEFSDNGQIQDAEMKIKSGQLNPEIQEQLFSSLRKTYQRFRIEKIQLQWEGNESYISSILNLDKFQDSEFKFEIVCYIKENGKWGKNELLVSQDGERFQPLGGCYFFHRKMCFSSQTWGGEVHPKLTCSA